MTIESIPSFTPPAARLWKLVPPEDRKRLLSNAWCGTCRGSVTITNFTGAVRGGDLLLAGLCSTCGQHVARLIESR